MPPRDLPPSLFPEIAQEYYTNGIRPPIVFGEEAPMEITDGNESPSIADSDLHASETLSDMMDEEDDAPVAQNEVLLHQPVVWEFNDRGLDDFYEDNSTEDEL